MKDELIETLHQPEYTGENRCEACTVVNVAIAAVLGAIVARKSKLAAAVTVGVSATLIYLRGYLVPGTPTLTKRYLPASVLRLFGKEPEPVVQSGFGAVEATPSTATTTAGNTTGSESATLTHTESSGSDQDDFDGSDRDDSDDAAQAATADETDDAAQAAAEDDPIAPEEYFLDRGVVEPCADVDDLCLTEAFETAWFDAIDAIETDQLDAIDVAAAIGLDDDDHEFEISEHGDARVLRRDGRRIGQWPSQAALVADVTAAGVLDSWDDEWAAIAVESKGSLLNSLRLFLETCPTSGGDVVMGEETVESCCQSHEVVAVTCEDTGERLFEHPVAEIEA